MRCEKHQNKVRFETLEAANASAARTFGRSGVEMGAYFKPSCGYWHLTRNVERAAKNRRALQGSVSPVIELRDYQKAAIEFLFKYFKEKKGNPIVAMPTGTGKSIVISDFVRTAYKLYPGTRIMMLTHVRELIDQNMRNLLKMWPTAPAGVFSAGLKRKEAHTPIVFAGIQSVVRKPELFGHIDLVLIDECHLVSPKDSTSYQKFINALKVVNPLLKVIGFSATPYRLGQGMLTDSDGIFTDICFDLTSRDSFNWMVRKGWISPLIPKQTTTHLETGSVRIQGGEYVQSELQLAVDKEAVTYAALREAINAAHDREHWLIFGTGIQHCEHIAGALQDLGIAAATVHSELDNSERDKRVRDFKDGRLRALVNNNVLTTGFDFPAIDCIVMLRPTASPVLWVQMLGRGTRPAYGKNNCLVLDFAGNTRRLGPINDPVIPRKRGKGPPGIAPVRLCEHCGCYSHAAARYCENPECGQEFPRTVKIQAEASSEQLIAGFAAEIANHQVDHVVYRVHKKEGRPDSMRVDYHCGLLRFSEYIMLDHGGYPAHLARQWWQMRCKWGAPPSVADGMKAVEYLKVPKTISVLMEKFPRIMGYTFGED